MQPSKTLDSIKNHPANLNSYNFQLGKVGNLFKCTLFEIPTNKSFHVNNGGNFLLRADLVRDFWVSVVSGGI